jgi:hypothetical protein
METRSSGGKTVLVRERAVSTMPEFDTTEPHAGLRKRARERLHGRSDFKGRLGGWVATGFEEVRAEFERNFAERDEIGAGVAAYWRGEKVVDL